MSMFTVGVKIIVIKSALEIALQYVWKANQLLTGAFYIKLEDFQGPLITVSRTFRDQHHFLVLSKPFQ